MRKLLLSLAMSLPLLAQGAWIDASGKPVPDSESMRSAGNFGVQIVLTPDDGQFRQTWEASKGAPKLRVTDSVRLGSPVSALLIFHGCTPGAAGACDVVAEFVLEGPGGAQTPAGGGQVWSAAPLPDRLLQLGQAGVTIAFDKADPLGNYNVIANVKDKVSARTLTVIGRLKVTN